MESDEASAARARHATADFLTKVCPWVDADAVMLVVSELVSNAVKHTAGWWRLRVQAFQSRLVVEIDDTSEVLPAPRTPNLDGGGGMGWHMVQRLATRVEVRRRDEGKTVCAIWMRAEAAPGQ
ncbi:ATP-binding protein [Streptomyces sp. NPDC002055]|uniref:ATP-binding protein n=1 Tax=Streptomyces sp. NPDC002055 TaxID=3154534 RepID=UPI0033281432